MLLAHSLAGVCGSAPKEIVGTKFGGDACILYLGFVGANIFCAYKLGVPANWNQSRVKEKQASRVGKTFKSKSIGKVLWSQRQTIIQVVFSPSLTSK
jgi:hypothetical protein